MIKDEQYQDSWHKKFLLTLKAQDLAEIADEHYVPDPAVPGAQELFALKQDFVFSVLYEKVQTSKGKTITEKYYSASDAQKCYRDLLAHHTKSTAAGLNAQDIQKYLTNTRIGDGKFCRNTEAFINHFNKQMTLYDELEPS